MYVDKTDYQFDFLKGLQQQEWELKKYLETTPKLKARKKRSLKKEDKWGKFKIHYK